MSKGGWRHPPFWRRTPDGIVEQLNPAFAWLKVGKVLFVAIVNSRIIALINGLVRCEKTG